MTLACDECGAAVELIRAETRRGGVKTVEHYRCVRCGALGSYRFTGDGPPRRTGSLGVRGP